MKMMNKIKQFVDDYPFVVVTAFWMIFIVMVFYGRIDTKCENMEPQIIYEVVTNTEYVEVDTGLTPYYKDIADAMTEEDYELIANITYLESGNQSLTGQRAVVEVIFNRVLDPRFPDTIKGVLSQPGQFHTYNSLSKAKPSQAQYDAINATLAATEPIIPKEICFFASSKMNRELYERIGNHNFYY